MIHADTVEALPTHGQAPLHYSTLTLLSIVHSQHHRHHQQQQQQLQKPDPMDNPILMHRLSDNPPLAKLGQLKQSLIKHQISAEGTSNRYAIQTMQVIFQMQNFPQSYIFLLWYINLRTVPCVNIVQRTMWWDVPSKRRPSYISHERGVRRCEDRALYCWGWKTKWAIRLSTRLSPSTNPDPLQHRLNIATRALWDHNMHNI